MPRKFGSGWALWLVMAVVMCLSSAWASSTISSAQGTELQCDFDGWSLGKDTFVLTCVPLRGHLTPLLYAAQELSLRGHNVLLAVPSKAMKWVPTQLLRSSIQVLELIGPVEEEVNDKADGVVDAITRALRKNFLISEEFQQPLGPFLEALSHMEECGYRPSLLFVDFISHFGFDAADKRSLPSVASVPMVGAYQHNTLLIPSPSSGFQLEMGVFERVISFMMGQIKPILHIPMTVQMNRRRKRLGLPSQGSINQYLERTLQLCYTTVGFEYAQLEPPSIAHVGPAQVSLSDGRATLGFDAVVPSLHAEVLAWLDLQAEKNRDVIYVSAGSTKILTERVVNVIDSAVTSLFVHQSVSDCSDDNDESHSQCGHGNREVSVLYNMEKDLFFSSGHWTEDHMEFSGRVLFVAEVEQPRVLLHEAVSLFVTHCGLNSVNEAILAAVPLVGIPHKFDQQDNAARIVDSGLGRAIAVSHLQAPLLSATILDVLEHHSEHEANALRLRSIALTHGGSSVAADLLEKALLTGTKHLMLNNAQQQPLITQMLPCLVMLLMCWTIYRLFRSVFLVGKNTAPGTAKRKEQ